MRWCVVRAESERVPSYRVGTVAPTSVFNDWRRRLERGDQLRRRRRRLGARQGHSCRAADDFHRDAGVQVDAVLDTSYYLLRVIALDNTPIDRWYQPSKAGCATGTGTCTASVGSLSAGPMRWQVLTWNASG